MSILLCRICLSELADEYVEISSRSIEEKTIIDLMEDIGEVTVDTLNCLPRHICLSCNETLCTSYKLRKQIQENEINFKEKRLTIVKMQDKTLVCFADKDFEIDKLMIISDSEEQKACEDETRESNRLSTESIIQLNNDENNENGVIKIESENEIDKFNILEITEENRKQIVESGKIFHPCPDLSCTEIFTSIPMLERHTNTEHLLHVCEICNDKFSTKTNLKKHMLIHSENRPYSCHDCDKKFRTVQHLKEHKIRLHTTVRPYTCDDCGKGFVLPYELKKHKKSKHDNIQEETTENEDTSKEDKEALKKVSVLKSQKFIYKCADCHKIFNSVYLYKKHQNTQHVPHICEICNKRFAKKISLKQHMLCHSGEKPYTCNECQKSFRSVANLKEHQMIMHSSDRPYVCEECGKGFVAGYKLKKHKQKMHSDEKPYICDICSKAFRASENLYHHRKFHNAKLIACNVCGKMVSNFSMKAHMNIHTNIRYECDICQAKFTIKESMLNHKRTVHEGLKRFQCKECGKKFTNSSGVLKHMRSLHMGVRYHCTVCDLIVKTKYCMNKHRRITHPDQPEESIINIVKVVSQDDEVVDEMETDNIKQ